MIEEKKDRKWLIASIAILSLAVGLGVFCLVYWHLNGKEELIALWERVKDFVNQPLPIVGISLLVVGGFVIKVVSMSAWGREKISLVNSEFSRLQTALSDQSSLLNQQAEESRKQAEEAIAEANKLINKLKEDSEFYRDELIKLLDSFKSVKSEALKKEIEEHSDGQ